MNFGELKTYLTNLINRKDVPKDLAGQFINQSINRLAKVVRPPFLQKALTYNFPTGTDALAIPTDFIELMNLYNAETELEQVDMGHLVKLRVVGGSGAPRYFTKIAGQFLLYPPLEANTPIILNYYRATDNLVADADENGWTITAVDAVVYGAAELAADYYEDDRVDRFSTKYATALVELQNQVYEDQWSGPLAVQAAYGYQDAGWNSY